MAEQKGENEGVLNTVARTVGSALGTVVSAAETVASTAEDIMGAKPEEAASVPAAKNPPEKASTSSGSRKAAQSAPGTGKQQTGGNGLKQRAKQRMKAKRAKHRRTLGRKTRG